MKCPRCGRDNPSSVKVCLKCGTALPSHPSAKHSGDGHHHHHHHHAGECGCHTHAHKSPVSPKASGRSKGEKILIGSLIGAAVLIIIATVIAVLAMSGVFDGRKTSGSGFIGGSGAPSVTPPDAGSEYTVTFDLNYVGAVGEPKAQTVKGGETISEPAQPTREGHTFVKWSANANGSDTFDFSSTINHSFTLYAIWSDSSALSIELTASETAVFTESDGTIIFYAKINNNNSSLSTVELYDAEGHALATMYDNGQYTENGDEFSNDDVFSCIVNIDVSVTAKKEFTAVGSGNTTVTSNKLTITVYESITEEQIEKMSTVDLNIQNNIFQTEHFETLSTDDRKVLADSVMDDLANNGLIIENSVYYDEDSGTYSFEYESGVLGAIIIKDWKDDQNGLVRENNGILNIQANESTEQYMNNTYPAVKAGEVTTVDADAVILWSFDQAWDDFEYRSPFYDLTEKDWEEAGVDTTVIRDTTVEHYKELEEYEIIVFSGHGAFTTYSKDGTSSKRLSSLLLHEASTKEKDEIYKNDLKLYHIGKISVTGGTMYAILPDFWNAYYEDGDLDGSFIYAENCEFYGNNGNINYAFATALTSLGAESVIGFHNSVMADYSRDLMKKYVDELIDGETTFDAFTIAKDIYGEDDYFTGRESYGPTAYPIFTGNKDSKLMDSEFKNGSFEENPALSSWKKSGDVRLISKLGALTPRHQNKMSILTTGIGSGTSDYKEATEGSVLYQTFKVPSDVTTLIFEYDVISEEPSEYVNTEFDDKFVAEIISLEEGNTIQIAMESVNDSEWFTISGIDFDGGDKTTYHTGWKTRSCDLSAYRGKLITLRFIVYDVGDSMYDTAALIDNITIK